MAIIFGGMAGLNNTPGSVSDEQWSRIHHRAGELKSAFGVLTGLAVAAAPGARTVTVSAGTALLPGVWADNDASATLTFAANTASTPRVDMVVLRGNWSPTVKSVSLATLQGPTSGLAPTPTQNPGVLFEIPLARVTIAQNATTLSASTVERCAPGPREALYYSAAITTTGGVPIDGPADVVAGVELPDPGWPYRVKVVASAAFQSANSGFGRIYSEIVQGGTTGRIETGQTGALKNGGATAQLPGRPTATKTGKATVNLRLAPPYLMAAGDGPVRLSGEVPVLNDFSVQQIPA